MARHALAKPLVLAIVALGATACVADAAFFGGQTSQDRVAWVRTDDAGLPKSIVIKWRARCGNGARLRKPTEFLPPYRERSRTFVRDGGSYESRVQDDRKRTYRLEIHVRLRAHLVSEQKWRGRFRARAEVRRNGDFVTTCRTGRVRWHATR